MKIPQVIGQDENGVDTVEYIEYGNILKKRYDEMNEKVNSGNLPKGMSMIEVMKPAQDLFNYCMMQLESKINANS